MISGMGRFVSARIVMTLTFVSNEMTTSGAMVASRRRRVLIFFRVTGQRGPLFLETACESSTTDTPA